MTLDPSPADAAPEGAPPAWDRLPGETPRAFGAFVAYREMGSTRSLRRLTESGDKRASNLRQLQLWSSEHAWSSRAGAWDDHMARQAAEAELEEVRKMRRRHASAAVALQSKALARLQQLQPDDLTARDVLAFIEKAVLIERAARGVEDQPVAVTHPAGDDLTGPVGEGAVTLEDLMRLDQEARRRAALADGDR